MRQLWLLVTLWLILALVATLLGYRWARDELEHQDEDDGPDA